MCNANQYPLLTIITPTYNRRDKLTNLLKSLMHQTSWNFEWLVIDDGSTDETREWFSNLNATPFSKKYVYKHNGGKHTALNMSHKFINGEYVVIVDSDDTLTQNAVKKIEFFARKYQSTNANLLVFLKSTTAGITLSPMFTSQEIVTDYSLYRISNKIKGDCCEVVRSDIFRKYPFPTFEGEVYLPEGSLWYQAGKHNKSIFINETVYIGEYLEGGLTKRGHSMHIQNPLGRMYTAKFYINDLQIPLLWRIKETWLFICYGLFARKSIVDIIKECDNSKLLISNIGFGVAVYWYWKIKFKNDTKEPFFEPK